MTLLETNKKYLCVIDSELIVLMHNNIFGDVALMSLVWNKTDGVIYGISTTTIVNKHEILEDLGYDFEDQLDRIKEQFPEYFV